MTKTLQLIPTLVFFSFLASNAQNATQEDYLVLHAKDTLYGTVAYINEKAVNRGFFKKVRLTDARGKTKKFKRDHISAFRLDGSEYHSFWLTQPPQTFPPISLVNPRYDIDANKGTHYFLKVVRIGNLSQYDLEWFDQGDSQLWSLSLLKKSNDAFFIRADQGFLGLKKKVLLRYFEDCPSLMEKIEKSELKEVWQVVEAYDTDCGKQKQ